MWASGEQTPFDKLWTGFAESRWSQFFQKVLVRALAAHLEIQKNGRGARELFALEFFFLLFKQKEKNMQRKKGYYV